MSTINTNGSMTLDEIEAGMQEQAKRWDNEMAHADGDDLLIALIRSLATPENKEQIERILETYDGYTKFYA